MQGANDGGERRDFPDPSVEVRGEGVQGWDEGRRVSLLQVHVASSQVVAQVVQGRKR